MNQFKPVEFAHASERVRLVYSDYLTSTRSIELPNWLKHLGQSQELAEAYWNFTKTVLLGGQLPYLLKELTIFVVSVTNGSPYCSAAHAHSILAFDDGLTFDDLVTLATDLQNANLPPATKVALSFARKLAKDPSSIGDADYHSLMQYGYSEVDIEELKATVTLGNMFNSFAISTGLPLDRSYRTFPLKVLAA